MVEEKKLEERVVGVIRSAGNDNVILKIEKSGKIKNFEIPAKLKNDFELIPYEMALINQNVKCFFREVSFERGWGHVPCTVHQKNYALEILSGFLSGKLYAYEEQK